MRVKCFVLKRKNSVSKTKHSSIDTRVVFLCVYYIIEVDYGSIQEWIGCTIALLDFSKTVV